MRRKILFISIFFGVCATGLWGLAAADTWGGLDPDALTVEANGACALTVLAVGLGAACAVRDAAMGWLLDRAAATRRDEERRPTRPWPTMVRR